MAASNPWPFFHFFPPTCTEQKVTGPLPPFNTHFFFPPVSHVVPPFTVRLLPQITSSSFPLFNTQIVSPSSFRFNSSPYLLPILHTVLYNSPILHLFCTLLIHRSPFHIFTSSSCHFCNIARLPVFCDTPISLYPTLYM